MKPIKFKGYNVTYAKDQPQYKQLPGYKFETERGEFVCCYKLSFIERMRMLFTGKLWISMITFNKPLTPILPTTKQSDVINFNKQQA